MTVADALIFGSIERSECEILLAAALSRPRTWLLAHPEHELTTKEETIFSDMMKRRSSGEPVSYITGEKEFFGRSFHVTQATLIPRPATELLIEQAMNMLNDAHVEKKRTIDEQIVAWCERMHSQKSVGTVIDVGTGSGCIAITLACELPHLHVIATDISEEALVVARKNAETLNVSDRIEFRLEKNLESIAVIQEPFFIVSNPPYIPNNTKLDRDVADYEPHAALFGGEDGADIVRLIADAARKNPQCAGFAIECRTEQVN